MHDKNAAQGTHASTSPVHDRGALRSLVAREIGLPAEDVPENEDLVDHGLDSVMAMRILSSWRGSGLDVELSDLMRTPTIAAWSNLPSEGTRERT